METTCKKGAMSTGPLIPPGLEAGDQEIFEFDDSPEPIHIQIYWEPWFVSHISFDDIKFDDLPSFKLEMWESCKQLGETWKGVIGAVQT